MTREEETAAAETSRRMDDIRDRRKKAASERLWGSVLKNIRSGENDTRALDAFLRWSRDDALVLGILSFDTAFSIENAILARSGKGIEWR